MAASEYIGLKTEASEWGRDIFPASPSWRGGVPSLDLDERVFIHGRDYAVKVPESPAGSFGPDKSQYVRVFSLFPDNVFEGSGDYDWIGRKTYVSKRRELLFAQELLGYPFLGFDGAQRPVLRRKLPEPLRWADSTAWTWTDTRGSLYLAGTVTSGSATVTGIASTTGVVVGMTLIGGPFPVGTLVASVDSATQITASANATASKTGCALFAANSALRYTHWAVDIAKIQGVGPKGQNPDATSAMWPATAAGVPPDECYAELRYYVVFSRVGYEVMTASDPYFFVNPETDQPSEWCRFVQGYQEEPSSRLLQIRGGVQWITADGYGQPTSNPDPALSHRVSGTVFAAKEGLPKLVGESTLCWKWQDVPTWAYWWDGIKSYLTTLNNDAPFTSTLYPPFCIHNEQALMLKSVGRQQKSGIAGPPLWDLYFYFTHSPADDGKGYFNRLYNNKGYLQQFGNPVGNTFFLTKRFADLFSPRAFYG